MKKIILFLSRFIDLRMGAIGAILMGGIVAWINIEYGWSLAAVAGLKQALYTFLFGGALIQLLNTLVSRFRPSALAIPLSTILISLLAILLVYGLHSLRGTPLPWASTMATVIVGPPGFLLLAIRARRNATAGKK